LLFKTSNKAFQKRQYIISHVHPIPIEIIYYHCKRSTRKYLKEYEALNGSSIAKIHNLVICKTYNKGFISIDDECMELVVYGVQVRYPHELKVDEQDMKFAIEYADKTEKDLEDILAA
jgi:hypothetical protein